ncbi:hypothetical protein V2W50_20715, partial [Acinetobacter baumannii]
NAFMLGGVNRQHYYKSLGVMAMTELLDPPQYEKLVVVGYAVMNLAVNFWLTAKGILPTTDAAILKANNIQNIIGIPSIDT